MDISAVNRAFRQFKDAGILGVALGAKEINFSTKGNPLSLAFFVRRKLPLRGASKRLSDGRLRIPESFEFQGLSIPTDVVTTEISGSGEGHIRSPPGIYRAGGKISNLQTTGTFGCLVSVKGRSEIFALTNRHISLDPGTVIAFPDFNSRAAVAATTFRSASEIADDQFLPFFDRPSSYVDVDCGIVRIASAVADRFSPDIPNFGQPAGIFQPSIAGPNQYLASLLGRRVFSYSWQSRKREGQISHVYYVYHRYGGIQRVACLLIKSADDQPPGLPGDSGKLWMTRVGDANLGVGVHFGVVADNPTATRFAMATELASLARIWRLAML